MKKLIAMLLALTCVFGLVACGGNANNDETPSTEPVVKPASALEVLEKTWAAVPEDSKFPVFGGSAEYHAEQSQQDENYQIPETPAAVDVKYTTTLTTVLLVPEDQIANISEAAALNHFMNGNNFTFGAYHVTGDVNAFVEAVRTAITGNQWMCGMPEKLIIAVVGGEYVLAGFGVNDALTPFETAFTATYPDAEIKYNEAITG